MMEKLDGRILIVDDDQDILKAARMLLKYHVRHVEIESHPEHILDAMKATDYDVIILDMNFTRDTTSGREGLYWLGKIRELDPSAIVILVTAYGGVDLAVAGMKQGATDFVLKPWQNEKLVATVSTALKLRQSTRKALQLEATAQQLSIDMGKEFTEFIGQSKAMLEVFSTIERVAKTEANVLILGANGTGKELAARAIHKCSPRKNQVFIGVDMGAFNENLFESELFGHMKGAFTDARDTRTGRFEMASGGTLFLDEIGNLPLALQPKLLSALQNREITRLGSGRPIPIDIRLICATNMDLSQPNHFRPDLLYRINTVEIRLPALCERREDIPLLARYFLDRFNRKYRRNLEGISKTGMEKLVAHIWPGNVRELQHAIERAVIMAQCNQLKPEDFILQVNEPLPEGGYDSYNLEFVEKETIRRVLKMTMGNVSRAAKELGLTRTSLYRRMEKFGL